MELLIEKQEDKLEVIGRVYSSTMAEITEFRTITARLLFWVSGASLAIVGWVVRESDSFDKYEKFLLCASVTTFLFVATQITSSKLASRALLMFFIKSDFPVSISTATFFKPFLTIISGLPFIFSSIKTSRFLFL